MLAITLHDLRFRARQFVIAVAGAGLVFAMGLLLSGLAGGFGYEVDQTVTGTHATAWVTAAGAAGRVASLPPIAGSTAASVAGLPGVRQAGPVAVVPQAASVRDQTRSLVLVGYHPGGLGAPDLTAGRPVARDGEAVVDDRFGVAIGEHMAISGRRFTVVGTTTGKTILGGIPDVYVSLADVQAVAFGGRPLISAVLVRGTPSTLPAGLAMWSTTQMEQRSLQAMAPAVSSIDNSRSLMWLVAAVIVAALVYVSALERGRDFAVLKALGSSSGALFVGLAAQAVLVTLVAAGVAAVLANFMTGVFAQPVHIPANAYVVLPVSAVVVGLLASLVALRRAVSVDPAAAFAGA